MLALSAQTQIYIAIAATDMRKGFDGLCGLVIEQRKKDPLCGSLYLFINKRRDRMKALYWDGDGLAIWYRSVARTISSLAVKAPVTKQQSVSQARGNVEGCVRGPP